MDILSHLLADHRRFHQKIAALDTKAFNSANKYYSREWSREIGPAVIRIVKELLPDFARHEEAEDHFLYPLLLKTGTVSPETLQAMEEEHAVVRQILTEFLSVMSSPEVLPTRGMVLKLLSLMNMLQQHMMREEQEIFEPARRKLTGEEIERLGAQCEARETCRVPQSSKT